MLKLKNIYECNLCLGSRTLHPEISIINLSDSCMQQTSIKFGVYAIILAEKCEKSHCCCGKGSCDYSYATMIFLPPEQTFRMDKEHSLPSKGYLLVFQPDQFDTSLAKESKNTRSSTTPRARPCTCPNAKPNKSYAASGTSKTSCAIRPTFIAVSSYRTTSS